MAWETRNGKGRYYTRSRKECGCVVRVYIGMGAQAEAAAEMDRQRRARLQADKTSTKLVRECYAQAQAALTAYCDDVDGQLRAALERAGYHQHKRGEWRRKRGGDSSD